MSEFEDPALPKALVEEINRRHLVRTTLEPSDLLFVFGTQSGQALFLREIERLWRQHYFRYAVVTGGIRCAGFATEAEAAGWKNWAFLARRSA